MKTVGRIVVILLAALLVAGGTYALGRSSWAQQSLAGGRDDLREHEELGESDGLATSRLLPDDFGRENGRFTRPFNLGSLFLFARTLLPITLVTLVVTLVMRRNKSTDEMAEL